MLQEEVGLPLLPSLRPSAHLGQSALPTQSTPEFSAQCWDGPVHLLWKPSSCVSSGGGVWHWVPGRLGQGDAWALT